MTLQNMWLHLAPSRSPLLRWHADVVQGLLASGIPPSTLQALLSSLAMGSGDFAAATPSASGLDSRTLASLLASGAFGAQNMPTTPPKVSAHS